MHSIRRLETPLLLCAALLGACPPPPDGPRFDGAGHTRPQRGGTLVLSEETKIRSLDPHLAFDSISGIVIEMVFSALYSYDESMQLVPTLAARLPELSGDGLTFRVPLRRGVRFHHGREVTAEDVVWSLERMLTPELNSPGMPYFTSIAGVDDYIAKRTRHVRGIIARDRYTVDITLNQADQSFGHKLAMRFTCVVPKEIVRARGARFAQEPVGTGPFIVDSWERGVRLTLRRNPHYYRPGLPYLSRIVVEEDINRETAFLRFRNGEVDIVGSASPADRALLETPKWRKHMALVPQADVYGIGMNAKMPPFDNVHVRRAVAFALDRERWAQARNHSIAPTGQMLPPAVAGYDAALPDRQRFDLARAREELRLAGFPNGLEEPITLWGVDGATARAYGELLQSDLGKIGIRVEFKFVSFPVYLEETGRPLRAQALNLGWYMDYPDASNFLGLVSTASIAKENSSNRTFYSHPWLDRQLDAALVERDPVKRLAMYREANAFVAREAPWAFIGNSIAPKAWQPYVKNYRPHPTYWLAVNEVWLDLPRRRQVAALQGPAGAVLQRAGLLPWNLRP